jgi:hypothetical protein
MGNTVAQFVTLRHPRLVQRLLLTATSVAPPPTADVSGCSFSLSNLFVAHDRSLIAG